MSIHLVYSEVIAKAKAAYLDGTLQAVHQATPDGKGCSYSACCAIGASLTPDQRSDMDRAMSKTIQYLLADKSITSDSNAGLIYLQAVHDRCLGPDREPMMMQLREFLGIPEAAGES